MKAKILNEIIGAGIKDIIVPEDCTYNQPRMMESSRVVWNPIQIILDNGEVLLLYGMIRLSNE
ncbi:hypothetical protein LCGC14_0925830 [marine sediment metagenome]|uniref:Uncharacterized protein n=1 Tax=marine sediment metagenome TaxID=412755 RepID=A0A0F9RW34_9ZZZZ